MAPSPQTKAVETHYTVFVRIPFPRGEFVDPPVVHWNASKDRALWKILSSSSKDAEIDWNALTDKFEVTLPFLLQQAAWLYERQLSQVREQLRKVNKPTSARSSPAPDSVSGSVTTGGYAMRRGGSGGSRVPSSMSLRARDSPNVQSGGPGTPVPARASPYSRTTSTNAIIQAHRHNTMPASNLSRRSLEADSRPEPMSDLHRQGDMAPRSPSPKAKSSSPSSSSSSDPPALTQSRAFTRRSRFPAPKTRPKTAINLLSSAEEDDEADDDSPAFLPFSNPDPTDSPQSTQDPSDTLRRVSTNPSRKEPPSLKTGSTSGATSTAARPISQSNTRTQPQPTPKTTHSSSSSLSSPFPTSNNQSNTMSSLPPGPTSPSAPLSALSPRTRRMAREGSEGTPSMGSSFSDLDDASVTQSALEEALAREIKEGGGSLGVVGRMGGLWRTRGGGRSGS